jgi:urea transport system permease protein
MLYAPQMKIITPYDMEPARSILVVIWVAVGGRGTLVGAILGALSVNLLYDYLTSEHDYGIFVWKAEYWQFVLGGLFVGVVLLFPQGLIRGWDALKSRLIPVESKKEKESQ